MSEPQTMDGRTDIWCAMRAAEMRIDRLERRLKAVEAHPALSVPSLPSPVSSVVGETCENCADQAECKLAMKGYPCMNHRKSVGGEVENVQAQNTKRKTKGRDR